MDARQRVAVGALGRPRAGRGRRGDATPVRPGGVAHRQPARLAVHARGGAAVERAEKVVHRGGAEPLEVEVDGGRYSAAKTSQLS